MPLASNLRPKGKFGVVVPEAIIPLSAKVGFYCRAFNLFRSYMTNRCSGSLHITAILAYLSVLNKLTLKIPSFKPSVMIRFGFIDYSFFLGLSHTITIGLDPVSPVTTVFPKTSRQVISS